MSVQVCYYRDKQSINKFKLATVTAAGVKITEPFALETEWGYKVSFWSGHCVKLQQRTALRLLPGQFASPHWRMHGSLLRTDFHLSTSMLQAFVDPTVNAVGAW